MLNAANTRILLGSLITLMLGSLAVTVITANPLALGITIVSAIAVVGISIYSMRL
jgi:hypothetical protein